MSWSKFFLPHVADIHHSCDMVYIQDQIFIFCKGLPHHLMMWNIRQYILSGMYDIGQLVMECDIPALLVCGEYFAYELNTKQCI